MAHHDGRSSTASPDVDASGSQPEISPRPLVVMPEVSSLLDKVATLPAEIIHHIILQALLVRGCAIRQFHPLGARSMATTRMATRLREEDLQRIEVYTRGVRGQRGEYHTLTHQIEQITNFFCRPEHDMWWDMKNPGLVEMKRRWPIEFRQAQMNVREEALYIFNEEYMDFPGESFLDSTLTDEKAAKEFEIMNTVASQFTSRILPFQRETPAWQEKLVWTPSVKYRGSLKPKFSLIRHLCLGCTSTDPLWMTRSAAEQTVWLCTAHPEVARNYILHLCRDELQWLWLDWNALRKLETLYLDMSCMFEIMARLPKDVGDATLAQLMNADMDLYERTGELRIKNFDKLNLKLLVIVGLKTGEGLYVPTRDMERLRKGYSDYHVPFAFTPEQVEDEPHLEHLGCRFRNWVRVFRDGLAGGGRLVLLDEREIRRWHPWTALNDGDSHDGIPDGEEPEPEWADEEVPTLEGEFRLGHFLKDEFASFPRR